jgi:hypothetical protein
MGSGGSGHRVWSYRDWGGGAPCLGLSGVSRHACGNGWISLIRIRIAAASERVTVKHSTQRLNLTPWPVSLTWRGLQHAQHAQNVARCGPGDDAAREYKQRPLCHRDLGECQPTPHHCNVYLRHSRCGAAVD